MSSPVDVSVVILTYNEEENLAEAIASVRGWAKSVFVFDSFSTDRTVAIARELGCTVHQHRFVDYAAQRQAALNDLPFQTDWVFFLDADERVPPNLRDEITHLLASGPTKDGYLCRFRLIWMGKWIRHGYYPTWILRLFRRSKAKLETRGIGEHVIVDGELGRLEHDIIHEDNKPLERWIEKHNHYTSLEADELVRGPREGEIDASILGNQAQRKRWIRHRVWRRLPPFIRPGLYFAYRYGLRGGFLDGKEAFAYHFLQALWVWMLVDIKAMDRTRPRADAPPAVNK